MKIKRDLKHGSFSWDDESKKFTITSGKESVELSKTYAFAFLRFAIRMAQRNWFRKQPKSKVTIEKSNEVTSLESNKLDGNNALPSNKKTVLIQREEGMEIEQYDLL